MQTVDIQSLGNEVVRLEPGESFEAVFKIKVTNDSLS